MIFPREEHVLGLEVAVKDVSGVHETQAVAHLNEVAPYGLLLNVLVCRLEFIYLSRNVSVLCKLHRYVEVVPLCEGVAVAHYVLVLYGGHDADLIHRILALLRLKLLNIYFLDGVELVVLLTLDLWGGAEEWVEVRV